jgi:hypothetical protein
MGRSIFVAQPYTEHSPYHQGYLPLRRDRTFCNSLEVSKEYPKRGIHLHLLKELGAQSSHLAQQFYNLPQLFSPSQVGNSV